MDREDVQKFAELKEEMEERARRFVDRNLPDAMMFDTLMFLDDKDAVCVMYWVPQCGPEGVTLDVDEFLEKTEEHDE